MKYNIPIIIVFIFVFSANCKKETPEVTTPIDTTGNSQIQYSTDTIYPLNYYPVFPGSNWKYIDGNGDTLLITTDSVYHLDDSGSPFFEDTAWVPVVSYLPGTSTIQNVSIWGYFAKTGHISHSGSSNFTILLEDTIPIGDSWLISLNSGTGTSRKVIARDTTVIVYGIAYYPTIVVEQSITIGPPSPITTSRFYFTKDIGLIKYEYKHSFRKFGYHLILYKSLIVDLKIKLIAILGIITMIRK